MLELDRARRQLIDSELMTGELAEQYLARWQAEGASGGPDGEAWIRWLVERQFLTEFQGDALLAGHTGPFLLGPYRVLGRVAAGRWGNIYHAVHEGSCKPVGLKVFPATLTDNPERLARVQREIEISAQLDHPNVVRTYQMGQVGNIHYLALEDLQGETLQDLLDRRGALPYETACRLLREAALGLTHFHDKSLIHRDVRPANMWITQAGTLKVLESGAVRNALAGVITERGDTLTTAGTVLGEYDYMAPEQAQNAHAADHRSDIYGLGCTLYHCLTGHPPFVDKNAVRLVMRHATEPPRPVSELVDGIPVALSDLVAEMLAKQPDERFQSMQDVAVALEQYAESAADQGEYAVDDFLAWLNDGQNEARPAADTPTAELSAFLGWLAGG